MEYRCITTFIYDVAGDKNNKNSNKCNNHCRPDRIGKQMKTANTKIQKKHLLLPL
jgi:hypothetical protein